MICRFVCASTRVFLCVNRCRKVTIENHSSTTMGNVLPSTPPPSVMRPRPPIPRGMYIAGDGRRIPGALGPPIEHDPQYEIAYDPTESEENCKIGFEATHRERCEQHDELVQLYNNAMYYYAERYPEDHRRMVQSQFLDTDPLVASMLKKLNIYGPNFEANVLLITRCEWASAMQCPGMQSADGLPEKDWWMLDASNVLTVLSHCRFNKPKPNKLRIYDDEISDDDQFEPWCVEQERAAKCHIYAAELNARRARQEAKDEARRDKTYAGKFYAIHRAKMAYVRLCRAEKAKSGTDLSKARCSVLTCWNNVSNPAFKMNSMEYCDKHRGVALFNGLRHYNGEHFCHACGLWNVLGLKDTCDDPGHVNYHVNSLEVPLTDACVSTHNQKNLTVNWFKAPGITLRCENRISFMEDAAHPTYGPHKLVAMDDPNTNHRYTAEEGVPLPVPRGAFAFVNQDGTVDAWIQVMGMDLRTNEPVPRMKNLDRIFENTPNGNPLLYTTDIVVANPWKTEEALEGWDTYTPPPQTDVYFPEEEWYEEEWHEGEWNNTANERCTSSNR